MHAYNGFGAGIRDLRLWDGWYLDVHFASSFSFSFSHVDILYLLTGLAWLTLAVRALESERGRGRCDEEYIYTHICYGEKNE